MVTLKDARRIISAAEKKATEIGQPMNIAVVGSCGNLVAHARTDNAWIGSIDISIKKPGRREHLTTTTKDLADNSQSGDQFFNIHWKQTSDKVQKRRPITANRAQRSVKTEIKGEN